MSKINTHPRISLNAASSMSWTFNQFIAFCDSADFRRVVLSLPKFEENFDDNIKTVKSGGFQCVSMVGGIYNLIENASQTLETLKPLIDATAKLESPSCYCLTGPTTKRLPTDTAYERLVDCLGPAVDYAGSNGVTFAVEHNSVSTRSTGFINHLRDAVDLSRDTGAGICVELQNCWYERNLAQMFQENVDRFVLVQVSDFVLGETLPYNRAVPGDGDMPLEWMLKRLLDAGYEGFFDLEFLGPHIEEEGYELAIRRGIEWLSERLDKWGA